MWLFPSDADVWQIGMHHIKLKKFDDQWFNLSQQLKYAKLR